LIGGALVPASAPVYSNDLAFDGLKYVFFSLAALELVRQLDWQPDIVHANDWHTAAAVYSIALRRESDPFFSKTATVIGVHNLPYLGVGAESAISAFGMPPAYQSSLPHWAINMPLPLGLLSADRIVAVSPTYAREILSPEFGSGLHEFLGSRQHQITGILNGLDTQRWDPSVDKQLDAVFTRDTLDERAKNKAAVRKELYLSNEQTGLGDHTPLLVMVSRMDYQKGVDLTVGALNMLLDLPWQAVILGTGSFDIEAAARALDQNHPQRVRAAIRFDPNLSRRLYASGDILLIPSRYEPCGLTQMIAMRYGCIPVARATGGLQDTIVDASQDSQAENSTGFLFQEASASALAAALRRALAIYHNPEHWRGMQQRGMALDFSWERSAIEYAQLYQGMLRS